MTTQEFSNEFDILYNNVMSNQAPGLDEYEKSVFLNKAQKDIVRSYFEDDRNKDLSGFDGSIKRQYDFSNLIKNTTLKALTDVTDALSTAGENAFEQINKFDERSLLYIAPSDLFLAINERVRDSSGRIFSVIPFDYASYNRYMAKPYAYPIKRVAWRLICDKTRLYNAYGIINPTVTVDEGTWEMLMLFKSKYYKTIQLSVSFVGTSDSSGIQITESNDERTVNIDITIALIQGVDIDLDEDFINSLGTKLSDYISDFSVTYTNNDLYYSAIQNLEGTTYTTTICPVTTLASYSASNETPIIDCPVYELIGRFTGNLTYNIRYVRQLKPIVLTNLSDIAEGLSIDGYNVVTECELPTDLHSEILQRAVEFAKASYVSNAQTQSGDQTLSNMVGLGMGSQTGIGMIQKSQQ